MSAASQKSSLIWLWLAVVIVVLDLWSKFVTNTSLDYGVPVEILPVFDLRLSYNTGAAFSFLADAGGLQRWFFVAVAVGVSAMLVVWMKRTPRWQWWVGIAQALVLGGALGNLYDRVVQGYVIDFISLHYGEYYFAVFNLADVAISVGATLLIIDMLFLEGKFRDRNETEGEA
ncbi:signal peptidase II [Pontibacterium sp. N1Y112]|uniref:Lipoprotein signal peptidase n=1 Tax=Pontibacterium sinense TaxID=2781979 RepID=A0A8J7FBF8_9GAMM|nr:signal peptidase II [Pontibacterium sinense]MBE9396997.1 signal peptidase II [Pontibacterium sinense]